MTNLKHLYHFVAFILLLAGCATSPENRKTFYPEPIVEKINLLNSDQIKAPWLDYNISEHPILFVSDQDKWAKRMQEGKLTKLDYSSWKKALNWGNSDFNMINYLNGRYLVIKMDQQKSEKSILATALHESFHWFYQIENRGFKNSNSTQTRGTLYPILSRPRYFRWMMADELFSFLQNNEEQHLKSYSWWYHEWIKQFPNEANNYTDRLEGSAQYYSILTMNSIQNLIENKNIPAYRDPFFTKRYNKDTFSLPTESYVLGPLTGFVLDRLKVPNWKKRVNDGEDSLSILASLYKPLKQKLNPILQREFLELSVQKMQEVDKDGKLDEVIVQLANSNIVKLVLNESFNSTGSFTTSGLFRSFFEFNGVNKVMMMTLASPYKLQSKISEVQYNSGDVLVTAKTPCHASFNQTILFFKPTEVQFEKGDFVASGAHPLNIKAKKIKNQNIYCAQD